MPSVNKTPNYNLNQWQSNEYPKREDFVGDNAAIDTQMKANADAAAAAQSTANAAIPKSMATAADRVLVSTGAGAWAVKTLAQFRTWLALTASNISDFAATVRSTTLAGLSTATSTVIAAADTVLGALGKLQAQITVHGGRTDNPHGVTATQAGASIRLSGNATLAVETWVGASAPYKYNITATGVITADSPHISCSLSYTDRAADKLVQEAWAKGVSAGAKVTAANTITLYADEKPTVVIPMFWEVNR